MTPKEQAIIIVKALDAKKAEGMTLLELSPLGDNVLSDYFVIATGTSMTHLRTLSDEAEKSMDLRGIRPHHIEGYDRGGWVLLDYGAVLVHLFLKDMRQFYMLERLWVDAPRVDLSDIVQK